MKCPKCGHHWQLNGFWDRFERGEVSRGEINRINAFHDNAFKEYRLWCQEHGVKHYLDDKNER